MEFSGVDCMKFKKNTFLLIDPFMEARCSLRYSPLSRQKAGFFKVYF
jgi:hypothetical protein